MTVTSKTCRHVRKNESSVHGKALLTSTQLVQDSIPVGKGMSVAHVRSAAASSKAESDEVWKAEREALQGEIQHLCHLVSLASTPSNFLSSSKTCDGVAPSCPTSATPNASQQDTPSLVQLKREELLKWKAAQLERQITLLQEALQSRSYVASEAESILSEVGHHLTLVAKEPVECGPQLPTKASELHNFSQQMLARLNRLTRQNSLSQARSTCPAPLPTAAFPSQDVASSCQVPFYPAPQSLARPSRNPVSVIGLSEGRGALLVDPGQTQQLESDMACLAPKLSSLAVLLRAAVLPAMSLVNPEVASRLQVEVAETAEAVSQSAHALTQLAVLLPSHTALFGGAAHHSAHQEGALRSQCFPVKCHQCNSYFRSCHYTVTSTRPQPAKCLVPFWTGGGFRSRHSVQRKLVFPRSFTTCGVCKHLRHSM